MSAGTFSLNPGPATPGIDEASFAGAITGGIVTGTTPVAALVGDLAARVKKAPMVIIQLAYMRAARDLCKRSMWLTRNIAVAPLVANQPVYNFGSDTTLEIIGVKAASVQQQNATWVNLRPTSQDTFDPNMAPDLPNWYSYQQEGMIVFYPTPNSAYPVKVQLICQTALNAMVVPNDLINKFNIYIEEGAMEHLYLMDQEPWFNPMLAKVAADKFQEGVGMARSWKDKGNQIASVRATPRPFISR